MTIRCERCKKEFAPPVFRGYCDDCITLFREEHTVIRAKHRPAPGIYADGTFADKAQCPKSVKDPATGKQICGLCGSEQLTPGYGLGTGYGMGVYNFCMDCDTFLDFVEDTE